MQPKNAVAFVLMVLGLGGMVRHFLTKDARPSSTVPAAVQTIDYLHPARPGPTPDTRDTEATAAIRGMRRRLREFVIPFSGVREHSLTDALAILQDHWETLPHETDAIPPATFTASRAALDLPSAQHPVFLQIPGISLLTNLQLLAAQTDLQLRITESGTILESPTAPDTGAESTATVLLTGDVVQEAILRSKRIYLDRYSDLRDPGLPYDPLLNPFHHPSGLDVRVRLLKMEPAGSPEIDSDLPQSATTASPATDSDSGDTSEVTATVSEDGYSIDLDLTPEVMEFEGFINYGEPIQTTGINALGEYEPIVLTDSKIAQPVFATRVLSDHQRHTVKRLFASLGIDDVSWETVPDTGAPNPSATISGSLPGIEWSPYAGTLTATGTRRTLRTAAALAAALNESATAGVKLEFASASWTGDHPPAEPASPDRTVPKGRGGPANSDLPQSPVPTQTSFRLRCGVQDSGALPRLDGSAFSFLPEPSFATAQVTALTEASGSRFPTDLTLTLPGRPDFLNPSATTPNKESLSHPQLLNPGHWHRIDLPNRPDTPQAPRQSIFVRLSRSTMSGK